MARYFRKKGKAKNIILKGKGIIIAVILFALLGSFILVDTTYDIGVIDFCSDTVNTVASSVSTFFTSTFEKIKNDWNAITDHISILEENKLLKQRIWELEREQALLDEYAKENKRLKELMNIDDTLLDEVIGYAQITGIASTGTYNILTVNKGTMDKVSVGMAVITPSGFMGTVIECHRTWSKVRCIVSPESAISVLNSRSRVIGIAGGNSTLYYSENLIYIKYLPLDSDIQVGDAIITSGYDEFIPKGVYVGQIKSISENRNANYLTAVVESNVDFLAVEEVIIVSKGK
ncbi:MAG: rod shape-determining protein MreC [Clostridiales bacterium]|nr:rod shape-determining protein MreC [Clostridiales bacterium]